MAMIARGVHRGRVVREPTSGLLILFKDRGAEIGCGDDLAEGRNRRNSSLVCKTR